MATEPETCENCNKIVSRGNEFTFGTDCYCNFPIELINLCQKYVDKENEVPVLNLEHIKQFREQGTFPQELAYIIEEDPRVKKPLPKTPAKPQRNLHFQDSLDESEDIDETVRTLRQALKDATREMAEAEARHQDQMDALSPKQLPSVTRFERKLSIARQNLADVEAAIRADDRMEMILLRDHLSTDIHKLEVDLQTTLGLLGDQNEVPVEYISGFREHNKGELRKFKDIFQLLENKIIEQEKSANMVAAATAVQTPNKGQYGMRPMVEQRQMPVLTPQVQFQYLHPTQQTKPKLKGQQAGVATAATGAPRTPNYSQTKPRDGTGGRVAAP